MSYLWINRSACRTFRLLRPLPVVAEFFAVRYSIEIYDMPHTAGAQYLVSCLPWQAGDEGRRLEHAGQGVILRQLASGFDVETGTLAEVLFLRLVRQGDALELAGPHCRFELAATPDLRKRRAAFRLRPCADDTESRTPTGSPSTCG